MKGRIIGPPVPVLVGSHLNRSEAHLKARLAVAVELDTHVCVPALIPVDVFPLIGREVTVEKNSFGDRYEFDFFIVKE